MSYTSAALRAAKEVQADTLAPELYRQAREWLFKARREYKFKNFQDARVAAKKARLFAEKAEFEALANGGNRAAQSSNSSASNVYGADQPPPEGASPTGGIDAGFEDPNKTQYIEQYQEEKKPKPAGDGGAQ